MGLLSFRKYLASLGALIVLNMRGVPKLKKRVRSFVARLSATCSAPSRCRSYASTNRRMLPKS
jgi:hypothetical protein